MTHKMSRLYDNEYDDRMNMNVVSR